MAHSISTVSLCSSTVSIKPLKIPATLCNFFTQVEYDFSVKFITLFQTLIELCNRSNAMLATSNAVEIFAGFHLSPKKFPPISSNTLCSMSTR